MPQNKYTVKCCTTPVSLPWQILQENPEDAKEKNKSEKDRQCNDKNGKGQNNKQWS